MPARVRAASATPAPRRRLTTSRIDLSATATALLKDASESFEHGSPGNVSLSSAQAPSGRGQQSLSQSGTQPQHRALNESVESLASSATLRPTSAGRQRLHHKPTAAQPNAAPRTVSPAIVPSPASAEAVHGRVERLSRLHRNWPGWGPYDDASATPGQVASEAEGSECEDDDGRGGDENRSGSASPSRPPRQNAKKRTSRREQLHALAREVTQEGTAVWSIVSEIGEALREANAKPQQHQRSSPGSAASTTQQMQAASARAAATATAALESLSTLFAVEPVLGPLFRVLFDTYKRACYIDHTHLLAESNIAPGVRDFVRTSTAFDRFDRAEEITNSAAAAGAAGSAADASFAAYVSTVRDRDWGEWVRRRSTEHWARATPHSVYRERTFEALGALGRDVAQFDSKLTGHRSGKSILRRGVGASGIMHAMSSGVAPAAGGTTTPSPGHGASSGAADNGPNSTPAAQPLGGGTSGGGGGGSLSATAKSATAGARPDLDDAAALQDARAAVDLEVVRMRVGFRAWRGVANRQSLLRRVIARWSGSRCQTSKKGAFMHWRLLTVAGKSQRRAQDVQLSEASFAEERSKRQELLAEHRSLERRQEALWMRCHDAECTVRRLQSTVDDLSSPMVWDFRKPIRDATTGQVWTEGVVKFRQHHQDSFGYSDLYFDLEHRTSGGPDDLVGADASTTLARESTLVPNASCEAIIPADVPSKSYYVIRVEDSKPAGTARPQVDPTMSALNHAVLAAAKNAWRDRKKAFEVNNQLGSSSPGSGGRLSTTSSPRGLFSRAVRKTMTLRSMVNAMKASSVRSTSPAHAHAALQRQHGHEHNTHTNDDASSEQPRFDESATTVAATAGVPSAEMSPIITHLPGHTSNGMAQSTAIRAAPHAIATRIVELLLRPIALEFGEHLADKQDSFEKCWQTINKARAQAAADHAAQRCAAASGTGGGSTGSAVDGSSQGTVGAAAGRSAIDFTRFEPLPAFSLSDASELADRPELIAAVAVWATSPAAVIPTQAAPAAASPLGGTGDSSVEADEWAAAMTTELEGEDPLLLGDASISLEGTAVLEAIAERLGGGGDAAKPVIRRAVLRALSRLGLGGRVDPQVLTDEGPLTASRRAALHLIAARLHAYLILKPAVAEASAARSLLTATAANGAGAAESLRGGGAAASPSSMRSGAGPGSPSSAGDQSFSGVGVKHIPKLTELAEQRYGRLGADSVGLSPVLTWVRHVLSTGARGGPYGDPELWFRHGAAEVQPRNFGEDFGDGLCGLVALVGALAPMPLSDGHARWTVSTTGQEQEVAEWLVAAAFDLGARIPSSVAMELPEATLASKTIFVTALYLAAEGRPVGAHSNAPAMSPGAASPAGAPLSSPWTPQQPTPLLTGSVLGPSPQNAVLGQSLHAQQQPQQPQQPPAPSAFDGRIPPGSIAHVASVVGGIPTQAPNALLVRLAPTAVGGGGLRVKGKPSVFDPAFKHAAAAWHSSLRSQFLDLALVETNVIPTRALAALQLKLGTPSGRPTSPGARKAGGLLGSKLLAAAGGGGGAGKRISSAGSQRSAADRRSGSVAAAPATSGAASTFVAYDAADDGEMCLALSFESVEQWLAPAVRYVITYANEQSARQAASSGCAVGGSGAITSSGVTIGGSGHMSGAVDPLAGAVDDRAPPHQLPVLSQSSLDSATVAAISLQVLRAWLQSAAMSVDELKTDAIAHTTTVGASRVVGWWKSVPREQQSAASRLATARRHALSPLTALGVHSGVEFLIRISASLHTFYVQQCGGVSKAPTLTAVTENLMHALRKTPYRADLALRWADGALTRSLTLLPDDSLACMARHRDTLASIFVAYSVTEAKSWPVLDARAMSRGRAVRCLGLWWRQCCAAELAMGALWNPTSVGLCPASVPSNPVLCRLFDLVFAQRCDRALRDDANVVASKPVGKALRRSGAGGKKKAAPTAEGAPDTDDDVPPYEALTAGKHAVPPPAGVNVGKGKGAKKGSPIQKQTAADPAQDDDAPPSGPPPLEVVVPSLAEYTAEREFVTFSGFCELLAATARVVYPVPWLRTADAVELMVHACVVSDIVNAAVEGEGDAGTSAAPATATAATASAEPTAARVRPPALRDIAGASDPDPVSQPLTPQA